MKTTKDAAEHILERALGCPGCVVPSQRAVEYRRWYYAACAYVDYGIGQLLRAVEGLGVEQQTITIFHSDTGYALGEGNEWGERAATEIATRVPLLVRVPWKGSSAGQTTKVLAELVDVYRTLVDLAGLNASAIEPDVQGTSLAPLFDNPTSPDAELAAWHLVRPCDRLTVRPFDHLTI